MREISMRIIMKCLLAVSLALLFMPAMVEAFDVVAFQEYDKTYYLEGDVLRVEKDLVMRNIGNNPIVPGEVRFRMYEVRGSTTVPSDIDEIYARDNSRELDARVEKYSDYSDLIVHVFNPILPGFDYPISISYELEFNPTGILFHEMLFPIEETTIPIRDSVTRLVMPNRYRVTFAPDTQIEQDGMRRTIEWDGDSELLLEYTRLPMPQMPFRMVSVFWLSVLMVLGVTFIYLNSRRPDRKKSKKR